MTVAAGYRQTVVRGVAAVNDRLGLRQFFRALDYFRCLEYVLAEQGLEPREELRLLDMGCGTGPFSLYLSEAHGLRVSALDLDPAAVAWQLAAAARLAVPAERFRVVAGDSRRLPFPDHSFDLVLNLSSIEHIPGDGDREAATEMGRVLCPGGRAVLTVPHGPALVEGDGAAHAHTFERRYDEAAVRDRLVGPSALAQVRRVYFGEPGIEPSRLWYRMPPLLRLPVRRLAPALAGRYLHPLSVDQRHRACGVCLVLGKPRSSSAPYTGPHR